MKAQSCLRHGAQRRSLLRKIEKLKQAKKENKAAQASARRDAQAAQAAADNESGTDSDYDPEADTSRLVGGSHAAGGVDATAGFCFTSAIPGSTGGFSFSLSPAGGAAIEDKLSGLGIGETGGEAVPPTGVVSPKPASCLPLDDVDAAFEAVWDAILPAVILPEHCEKAEAAFDTVCTAVPDAAADRMSDAVAESAAGGEAAVALATLREILRWRSRFQNGDSQEESGDVEAVQAALVAAESAARVLHQLLTMSRSWALLSKWSAGVRQGAAPF